MGDEVKHASYSRVHRQEYRRKVQLCLDVFETMLAQSSFDFDRPLTGMEIECNLVDADYQPAMSNQEVLAAIADPAYQTELGSYNIEFNVPPRPLPGRTALELEAEVRTSLNAAETKANTDGACSKWAASHQCSRHATCYCFACGLSQAYSAFTEIKEVCMSRTCARNFSSTCKGKRSIHGSSSLRCFAGEVFDVHNVTYVCEGVFPYFQPNIGMLQLYDSLTLF